MVANDLLGVLDLARFPAGVALGRVASPREVGAGGNQKDGG